MRTVAATAAGLVGAVVISAAFAGSGQEPTVGDVDAPATDAGAATTADTTDCVTTTTKPADLRMDPDQVENTKKIIDQAIKAGVGRQGARIAISAALVEAGWERGEPTKSPIDGLHNIPYGMGSSVGIFQELKDVGSVETRMDVSAAAGRFFALLKKVDGWERMDPGDAAQAVQRSRYPKKYAKRMAEATRIVDAYYPGGKKDCKVLVAPSAAGAVGPAVAWAASKDGKPYVWGGTGPNSWDCSGLMLRAFEQVGVKLPRTAEMQRSWLANGHGIRIQPGQEQPGDMIFIGRPAHHVVMVYDVKRHKTIEALQTCRSNHKGAGIDCGVGHFDYKRRLERGAVIYRVKSLANKPAPKPAKPANPAPAAAAVSGGRTIVIDPGHNGGNAGWSGLSRKVPDGAGGTKACNTAGTEGGGYEEHAFTWDVASRLRRKLEASGYRVVMTRPNDSGRGPCVDERARIGNDAGAALVVSIHADGSSPKGRGFHVIRSTHMAGGGQAEAASSRAASTFVSTLEGAGVTRSNYVGGGTGITPRDDIAGLNHSRVPAVMVESGNMSNARDLASLKSAAWRDGFADALASAVRKEIQ